MLANVDIHFASPRKLPDAETLTGRVVVLDIAFAASAGGGVSFETVTLPFIEALGPRLAAWVDHHDHPAHPRYQGDERFLLTTKAQAGACPEMIDPALVARVGPIQTLVTHLDLDGLYAAATWLLEGSPPYPEAHADARAVDTRMGAPSPIGQAVDQALRARYRDDSLRFRVLRFLTHGCDQRSAEWAEIREASARYEEMAQNTRQVADRYRIQGRVALIRIPPGARDIDKTLLLLLGQERADVAVVQQSGMITVAAPFESGLDFPTLLGLGGGMPTRATAPEDRLPTLLEALNGPAGGAPPSR